MAVKTKITFKPADIAKLYKDQAVEYDKFVKESFSTRYLELPLVGNILSELTSKPIKILDAGCGSGIILKYLVNKNHPVKNIIGIDNSNEMLALARKNAPGIKILKSDITKSELKDKFDLIICNQVMHYLDDKDFRKALNNFYRLLNPGGILLFIITHPVRTARHNLAEYFKRDWIIDHTPWGTASPLFLRPVSDMVNETIKAGFLIKSLTEPVVPPKTKDLDLNNYLKYSSCPSLVAVAAMK
jgi:SAM-dependent methyltransferase